MKEHAHFCICNTTVVHCHEWKETVTHVAVVSHCCMKRLFLHVCPLWVYKSEHNSIWNKSLRKRANSCTQLWDFCASLKLVSLRKETKYIFLQELAILLNTPCQMYIFPKWQLDVEIVLLLSTAEIFNQNWVSNLSHFETGFLKILLFSQRRLLYLWCF